MGTTTQGKDSSSTAGVYMLIFIAFPYAAVKLNQGLLDVMAMKQNLMTKMLVYQVSYSPMMELKYLNLCILTFETQYPFKIN